MFDEEFVQLRAAAETFRVTIRRVPRAPSDSQSRLGRRALRLLRFGIETRDPALLDAARRVLQKLDGRAPELGAPFAADRRALEELDRRLTLEFTRGRLVVEAEQIEPIREPERLAPEELAPLPPVRADGPTTFFDVRYVDEIGQGINGLAVEFLLSGKPRAVTTNAAGVALLEGVTESSAAVSVVDLEELESIVEPRWEKLRQGKLAEESNSFEVVFRGAIPSVSLRAALPHRVVIKPPLGRLFVELFDRSGRVRHAKVPYEISGPQSFSDETDENGRLLQDGVLPGDYTLKFKIETDLGEGPIVQELESQLVVLPAGAPEPEVRLLGAVPRVVLARLKGMFFDTNKSFLLPASTAVLERLRKFYADNDPSHLVIVGHADTTGDKSVNDPLSLERADNTAAYLKDDVDTWLAMFETSVPEARRWGDDEDQAMLFSMPDFDTRPPNEAPIRWFQRTRGLTIDGEAGPETRRQLITEYMALDGASLGAEEREFDIEITTHGCGENFPLDETGEELDQAPPDGTEDQVDRRVELFFFDKEFGIVPKPPGKNSPKGSSAYPEWRKRAKLSEFSPSDPFEVPCHLDLELRSSEGTLLAGRTCKLRVGAETLEVTTDDDGRFVFGPLEPDDFLLQVGSVGFFVTSFSQNQDFRTITVPDVDAEALEAEEASA